MNRIINNFNCFTIIVGIIVGPYKLYLAVFNVIKKYLSSIRKKNVNSFVIKFVT